MDTVRIVILCGYFGPDSKVEVEAYLTKTAGLFVHKTVNAAGIWQGTWSVTLGTAGYSVSPCYFRTRKDAIWYANLFGPHDWDGVTASNTHKHLTLRDKCHALLLDNFTPDRWGRVATRSLPPAVKRGDE